MTQTINRYGIYKVDHTTFGGTIYLSDFETEYRGKSNSKGSVIAARILSDWKFDRQCGKNIYLTGRKTYGN